MVGAPTDKAQLFVGQLAHFFFLMDHVHLLSVLNLDQRSDQALSKLNRFIFDRAFSRDSKKTYHALAVTVVPRGEVMGDYFCPLSYVDIRCFSGPASWQNDELCST